jgi:hypothetical protein
VPGDTPNSNYELTKNLSTFEFPFIWINGLKIFEQRNAVLFLIFTLPYLGLCTEHAQHPHPHPAAL